MRIRVNLGRLGGVYSDQHFRSPYPWCLLPWGCEGIVRRPVRRRLPWRSMVENPMRRTAMNTLFNQFHQFSCVFVSTVGCSSPLTWWVIRTANGAGCKPATLAAPLSHCGLVWDGATSMCKKNPEKIEDKSLCLYRIVHVEGRRQGTSIS